MKHRHSKVKQVRFSIISDVVDNSGMRMILTPNLRQHDAGGLTVGVNVDPEHFIPPFLKNFLSTGFCSSECTERVSN